MSTMHGWFSPRSRRIGGILGLLLLLVSLASCGGSTTVTTPTPTPRPSALQFSTIDLGIPAAALNSPIVGNLPDTTKMHLDVTFKVNQQILDQLKKKKIQTGQSQNLNDVANKLGISDSTYQQIKNFLGTSDITFKLGKLHTNLAVDAPARAVAKVFQTSFVIHQYKGRTFFAPATAPKLPTFIASHILSITGLDNYTVAPKTGASSMHLTAQRARTPAADCNASSQTFITPQIAHAYGYDAFWQKGWHGEGITINLVEIDGIDQTDLQNYFQCVHYTGQFKVVDVGTPPSQPGLESALDIELIAGLAPAANIVDYQSDINASGDPDTQLNDELQAIINDNTNNTSSGSIVSISLGQAEGGISRADLSALNQSLKILTQVEHMTVFVASGDCAAFQDGTFNDLSVSYPASDPFATAVGGTILRVDSNSNHIGETAWTNSSIDKSQCGGNANLWGTGGGNSTLFQQPSYQTGSGVKNQYSTGVRQLPDVSAVALGLATYFQGQWGGAQGTSAAAPIWAAGMALVNQGLKTNVQAFYYGTDLFYGVANSNGTAPPYYDVTQGNNLYYPSTPGWDYPTGVGTPNLVGFFNILLASAKQPQ